MFKKYISIKLKLFNADTEMNNKFREQLTHTFLLYDMNCTENDTSNFLLLWEHVYRATAYQQLGNTQTDPQTLLR
jgi:hypothetical protein